jgi:hypothetical protein
MVVKMSGELQEGEIAREAAEALSADFGPEVVAETEKQLAAGTSGKRGFLPGWASDAAAIAGILIGAIQLAKQLYSEWRAERKLDELKAMLEERAPSPERIDAATRSKILQQVIDRLPKPGGS